MFVVKNAMRMWKGYHRGVMKERNGDYLGRRSCFEVY
jgi:hypothetical protein